MPATFPFPTPAADDAETGGVPLLEQGSVVPGTMGPFTVWLAIGHAAAKQVLTDQRFSTEAAQAPGSPVDNPSAFNPHVLSNIDGERHTRMRKLMAQPFSPRTIRRLEARAQSIVDELLDGLSSPADLVTGLTAPLPMMMICELLGAPYADAPKITGWSKTLMSYSTPEQLVEAVTGIQAYLAELVEEKRRNPDDALISELTQASDEHGHLTEVELINNLQMLIVAGHETTVNQLGNSFVSLFRHPDQLELLRGDLSLVDGAVEELMRYSRLVVAALPRLATEPVELDGVQIAKDEAVVAVLSTASRDPKAFDDPDRLDITRSGAGHLGFGHGRHVCLGAQLARMEMRVALTSTLKRFPTLRLAIDPAELTYVPNMVVRSLTTLPVEW